MRQRTVLLITPDSQEGHLTQQAFAQAGLHHTLQVVADGEEALAYLHHTGAYADPHGVPPPDVILLHLPLPRSSGPALVQRLKQDPSLKRVPLIVLITSGCTDEMQQVSTAGANAYLWAPEEQSRFTEVVGGLGRFWLETVALPSDA